MKYHYHIKFCGDEDYSAFQNFLTINKLKTTDVVIDRLSSQSVETTYYHIFIDLTTVELMMLYLTVTVIKCIPLRLSERNLEIIG